MSKSIKEIFIDNLDKIIVYVVGAISSGSLAALFTKLFEKKLFNKLNLGIVVIVASLVFVIIISVYYIIRKRKIEAKKEYTKILKDIEKVLHLENWSFFISGAQDMKFSMDICDYRDDLGKYFDANNEFWSKKDRALYALIFNLKDSFIEMYSTVSKHLKPNTNFTFLIPDKFYHDYYGKPEAIEKENEFTQWGISSWKSVENYVDKLNDIVKYAHKKKYNLEDTNWNTLFLKY